MTRALLRARVSVSDPRPKKNSTSSHLSPPPRAGLSVLFSRSRFLPCERQGASASPSGRARLAPWLLWWRERVRERGKRFRGKKIAISPGKVFQGRAKQPAPETVAFIHKLRLPCSLPPCPPPPPARPLHSSLPPSKNADGAAHLRVPGARWSPRPGAQGRPLGGTLRKSESTIPRPVFLISVVGGKRSRRTLGAMPPLLSKGKFHLPAASNYGQLCRFRDLQLCRCTLLDRSYRLASEGDASDVPKGSIRGGGRDQVFFVRRNLTLSTFFFLLLLLPPPFPKTGPPRRRPGPPRRLVHRARRPRAPNRIVSS